MLHFLAGDRPVIASRTSLPRLVYGGGFKHGWGALLIGDDRTRYDASGKPARADE